MSTVPDGKNDKISYFENRAPVWVSQAATLGVDPTLAAQLQTNTTAARSAFNTQENAKTALRNAVGEIIIRPCSAISSHAIQTDSTMLQKSSK